MEGLPVSNVTYATLFPSGAQLADKIGSVDSIKVRLLSPSESAICRLKVAFEVPESLLAHT